MTTDKYIISPKLRNELEGFGKGYDKALEDVEKIIFQKQLDYKRLLKYGNKINTICSKEVKARRIKTNSHLKTKINLLQELKQQLKQLEGK